MATASDVASPLCTWLVAACMSAACGGGTDSVSRKDKWRRSAAAWTGGVGLRRSTRRFTVSGKARAVSLQPEKAVIEKKKPDENRRRVVVTGLGVVTPLGHDPDVFYNNLLEGVSGISEIESFDCSSFPTRIAGEIKSFSSDGWVEPKLARRSDEIKRQLDKTKCGVLIGSAMGGMKVFSDAIEALEVSCRKMNPHCVPCAITNMGSANLVIDLGWMGPNYSISASCATSNFCILNAANHIRRGEADMMFCGGSDGAIIPIGLGGFVACRALSQRNGDPTKASRPWDMERDGFVMGEGAGVLVLEELQHAKKRGAKIYAEFLGGGFTSDAYHMTEPHPESSTPSGDLKEYQALIRCFGQNSTLRVNSTKSMTGHLLGAAGGVEAVATVQAIRTGWVHLNINLDKPDNDVDINVLVGSKRRGLTLRWLYLIPLDLVVITLPSSLHPTVDPVSSCLYFHKPRP